MFAAIAAMVMVSVSNAFASSRMVGNAEVAPVDTVAPAHHALSHSLPHPLSHPHQETTPQPFEPVPT